MRRKSPKLRRSRDGKELFTARVRFCSGSNKCKGSVRFEFFTIAENLGSGRVRLFSVLSSVWFYNMSSCV